DWKSRLLVNRVGNFFVRLTAYAVLWREERSELHARRFAQNVYRLTARAVAPRVVRNQPDAQTLKLFEPVAFEHVNAVEDFGVRGRERAARLARARLAQSDCEARETCEHVLNVLGLLKLGARRRAEVSHGPCDDVRDTRAQCAHVALAVGVHAVR